MPVRIAYGKKKKGAVVYRTVPLPYLPAWMDYCNRTQADIAQAIGASEASISRYISGEQNITLAALQAIAQYLNTDVASLLTRDPRLAR